MSNVIYTNRTRYLSLFGLSENNITQLYGLFNFFTNEVDDYISYDVYKILRTIYINVQDKSDLEEKKWTTYDEVKAAMININIANCKVEYTRLQKNTVVCGNQLFSVSDATYTEIMKEFKNADDDSDGYLTFDNFMYAMFVSPLITWTEFWAIISLTADKIEKCMALFMKFSMIPQLYISAHDLLVVVAIINELGITGFTVADVTDKSINIFADTSYHVETDRKFYYFYFKETLITYFVMNDQEDIMYTPFEYMHELITLI